MFVLWYLEYKRIIESVLVHCLSFKFTSPIQFKMLIIWQLLKYWCNFFAVTLSESNDTTNSERQISLYYYPVQHRTSQQTPIEYCHLQQPHKFVWHKRPHNTFRHKVAVRFWQSDQIIENSIFHLFVFFANEVANNSLDITSIN